MNANQRFWDKTAEKYSKRPIINQEVYLKKQRKVQKILKKDMSILEIGCGTGSTAISHANYVREIIANDFSENMIKIAKEKAKVKNIKNINFKHESIEEMNYKKDQFDIIIADNIFHLLEDFNQCLKKVKTYLKPGGYLITTTPCTEKFFKYFKYIWLVAYKLKIWPYFTAFNPTIFKQKIKENDCFIEYEWHPNKFDVFIIARKS